MRGLLATCALVASSALAQGYVRTVASDTGGSVTCVAWGRRTLTYRVDAAGSAQTPGDTEFTALDSAFAEWQVLSTTCSDFTFTRGPRITAPKIGRGTDADNVLTFREAPCRTAAPPTAPCHADGSCGNAFACWDHSDGTIALTTLTYSTRTGLILDADVEFNAATYLFTTISAPACEPGREAPTCAAYDLQNTATHELGHVLGFDHVDAAASTMAPTAPLGETSKRRIDPGTADGFCFTYPARGPPTPCDEQAQLERRIVARSTGCASTGGAEALGPWGVAALLWRARRRRGH